MSAELERPKAAFLAGRWPDEWVGLRVEVDRRDVPDLEGAGTVSGIVTEAKERNSEGGHQLLLRMADTEGFLVGGIDCRAVRVVQGRGW